MKDWNHQYAKVNGVKLHYVKEGNGDTLIVLLHGWPEFWYSWRHQIGPLSREYTVVAPDMRGFNDSGKPKGAKNYTQEIVGADIVELIKHLGFEKAIIVGHDWGGAVAWHIALNYPDMVQKFVVINCPHPALFVKNLKSNPRQLFRSWYMFFFQLPIIPEFILGKNLKQFFTKALRGWSFNKEGFSDEVIDEYVKAYSKEYAMTGGFNYYRANISAVRSEGGHKGRKVKAPTLMIWGEDDNALGKELTNGTEAYIDNSFDLRFIPNCSHWVQNDHPERVSNYILEFLKD